MPRPLTLTPQEEKELISQAAWLDNQALFELVINKIFDAGLEQDLKKQRKAETLRRILGKRLGFSAYQAY